jgi:hypothetical protein
MTAPSNHPGPGPAPEGLAPPAEPPAAATPPKII